MKFSNSSQNYHFLWDNLKKNSRENIDFCLVISFDICHSVTPEIFQVFKDNQSAFSRNMSLKYDSNTFRHILINICFKKMRHDVFFAARSFAMFWNWLEQLQCFAQFHLICDIVARSRRFEHTLTKNIIGNSVYAYTTFHILYFSHMLFSWVPGVQVWNR